MENFIFLCSVIVPQKLIISINIKQMGPNKKPCGTPNLFQHKNCKPVFSVRAVNMVTMKQYDDCLKQYSV